MKDAWNVGEGYEAYVGRWSRLVARAFVDWLALGDGRRWIDVGCGTGALSEAVLERARPASILGVDASAGFVAFARRAITDARVRFEVGDARALPCEDGGADAAISGLVLNFIPTPEAMLAEMVRAVKPGGTVAAYVWDYAGEMQLMRRFWDAASALDPAALELDEARRFPLCNAGALAQLWQSSRLDDVETKAIDVPTQFRDFDDYWRPFLGGQGPAPTYVMSLDDERRTALRERLRTALPATADGRIALVARAWAVRGRRPA